MTQDEVDLIYDYLHENYEYSEDGELIRTKASNGHVRGDHLGSFYHEERAKKPGIKAVIVINKKRFGTLLSRLIWIYHFKKSPKYIDHIDGNPVNNRIENLKELCSTKQYIKNTENSRGVFVIKNREGIKFRALISRNKKPIFLGHFDSENEAKIAYKIGKYALLKGITDPIGIKKYVNDRLGYNKAPINNNINGFKNIKKTKAGTFYGCSIKKGLKIYTKTCKTPEEAYEQFIKKLEEYKT